jgi:hypothetical protein
VREFVSSKPDFIVVLAAAFGIGVLITLLLPVVASDTVAAPASELQAGIVAE